MTKKKNTLLIESDNGDLLEVKPPCYLNIIFTDKEGNPTTGVRLHTKKLQEIIQKYSEKLL